PGADLSLSFYAAASNPPVGSNAGWGISVHNLGPATTTNVQVRAAFPAGYTFTSKSVPVGSYDEATGIWTLGTVVRGAGPNFAIVGTVNSTGPYDLTATIIESSAPDPNPANNTRTDIVTPNANADLRVSFFGFSGGTRQPGDIATMLFDVVNDGPASASNVTAEVRIPAGFTIAGLSVTSGTTYDQATGNWTIGNMHYGRLVRVQVDLRVNATGPIELRAAVTNSSAPDPNLSNNVVIPPRINRPPVANAGADQPASAHSLVSLDGSASFDADGDPITYEWNFALRPINSAATLSSLATASSSFVPDLGGSYVAQLRVTDSFGLQSAPDVATISTVVTNRPPVIGSLPVTTAAVTQSYGYDVNATDPDVGDPLTFSLTTAPAGMTIAPASGLITWTPAENQAGPQLVGVRVQDAGGLFAAQSFAIQVSSPGNGAPLATDDAYSVRVSESLSEPAPGVVGNDTDESALAVRLISPPGNGTVLLNQDGSFTYTPHVMNPGEFVLAENVNLAARIPGATWLSAPSNCPRCGIDESLSTKWPTFGGPIEIVFPADVMVSQVTVQATRSQFDGKITAAIFELIDANGVELYDSGPVEIPGPLFDATLNVPNVPGVRRVRLTPTASPTNLYFATLAELKVIGSGLIRREPFVEPNLVQLLPATVTASSELIGNVKESLTDESDSNWYST
ncbi:MAG TPA: Ig-like domain-containing protein, partial [Vicinamibacterales bacterium]|nr:Ig-like domain-containing protein [Vicinamibacterales bacterium]